MLGRRKGLLKHSSEEVKSTRDDSDNLTHQHRLFSNGKQKYNRHFSPEIENRDNAKGNSKANVKSNKSTAAKRHGHVFTPGNKRRNSDSSATVTQVDRKLPSKGGCSLDLEDMRYPAEYVPPAVDTGRRRSSAHRVSYRKAIQKAGYNMNELGTQQSNGSISPAAQQNPTSCLTDVDWSENASADHHIWAPTNASGELCYVGEDDCEKSGPRKKCDACHIVVHEACFPQLLKIAFNCKKTFRESAIRASKESLISHHHWVHRRKQEGKCKQCGKSFEKRFGFRETTKIIAISCSWCKEAYHNKVSCFRIHKINEPCSLGIFSKSIVPPTWIVKQNSQKQKSVRNRSKKRKSSSGISRKKSASRENRSKTFSVRPLVQQAAFLSPILVFINPKSGGRQGAKLLQSFRWFLNPRQVFDLSQENPTEAIELYRRVPNLRILACGGDGTVGWILSVLDKLSLPRPPPVAVLPLGTGNDLSRTLNFGPGYTDEPVKKIIMGVEEARMVKLDRWKLFVEKNDDALRITNDEEGYNENNFDGTDKPPLEVINNYFSIGADAQVSFNFHESREAHPAKFTSRFGNKFFYARAGVNEYVSCQSKNLWRHITVVCDGINITPKIHNLKPVCVLFLNIPKYSSGMTPWGHPTGNEFQIQSYDDKLIEVLAFTINQLGMLFVGGHGERLCQCKSAIIHTTKTFPIQIDGEPCKLNPSHIKLEFFNQANMLAKHKRRSSMGLETQQSHEQMKIRINMINNENFETFRGKRDPLCFNAVPLLVTVVMNQSTLDTVRSCLLLTLTENDHAMHNISDKWVFLDSSSSDKLYKIDKNQENRLIISDVISGDKEVYILDVSHNKNGNENHLYNQRLNAADKLRNRIRSDSGIRHSGSSNVTSVTKNDLCDDAFGDSLNSDPASTLLDVVFEQPELCQTLDSPSSYDDVTTSSVIGDVDVHEEEHPTQDVDLGTTESQPLLNEHRETHSKTKHSNLTSGNFSRSSESLVSRIFPLKHNKSPLRAALSNPVVASSDTDLSKDFKRMNINEHSKLKRVYKRSNSDTNPNESTNLEFLSRQSTSAQKDTTEQNKESFEDTTLHIVEGGERRNFTQDDAQSQWSKVLLDASKRGDVIKACQAIESGADVYARDEEGCTALHHAVRFSHEALVDLLLNHESKIVDLMCRDRKQSALHKAAWYGRIDLCKKLVTAGASLDITDYKGMTAIDRAKQSNSIELVEFLEKIKESKMTGKPFHETDL